MLAFVAALVFVTSIELIERNNNNRDGEITAERQGKSQIAYHILRKYA